MQGNDKPNVKSSGLDALSENVINVLGVANILGQTLGPKGIDVLTINNVGSSVVSNDGATILSNLAVNNPIIQSLVESAEILAERVGDGTTSFVVIAGQLCYGGLILNQDEDVDTVTTTKGYQLALTKSLELLNKYSMEIDVKDKNNLKGFVKTTLTGKNSEGLDTIYDICVDAVVQTDGELNKIRKLKIKTGSISQSELVKGIVLDVDKTHEEMPELSINPKVLVLDDALELVNPALDMKIDITGLGQYKELVSMEKGEVIARAEKIRDLGVNVVISQRNIHDYAIDYFFRNGILAIRNVPKADAELVAKSLNASVVKNLDTAKDSDLGIAESVELKKYTNEKYVVIKEPSSKVVTIVIGGSNKLNQDEYERGIDDALGIIKTILNHKRYVYGAGVIEVKLAYDLREYAKTVENGKLQASIEKYANALEYIPKLLANSSGQSKLSALGKMRINRDKNYGIDVENGEVKPITDVLEPTELKRQIYTIATEFAINVLRIRFILQGRLEN